MKIAIPVDEDKNTICVSFGRTSYFLFYQTEMKSIEILKNPAAEVQGGAGIKAAQFIVDQGVEALITVRCGQNAAEVLQAADISIYKADKSSAVETIQDYQENKLAELTHFHAGFQGIQ